MLWASATAFGLQAYAISKGQTFDMSQYGIGMGAIMGGGMAGIAMKDRANVNINVNQGTDGSPND